MILSTTQIAIDDLTEEQEGFAYGNTSSGLVIPVEDVEEGDRIAIFTTDSDAEVEAAVVSSEIFIPTEATDSTDLEEVPAPVNVKVTFEATSSLNIAEVGVGLFFEAPGSSADLLADIDGDPENPNDDLGIQLQLAEEIAPEAGELFTTYEFTGTVLAGEDYFLSFQFGENIQFAVIQNIEFEVI